MNDLRSIPGVGPRTEADLLALGYSSVDSLIGADAEELYEQECLLKGTVVDRCQLYIYRCAIAWAESDRTDKNAFKWWHWKTDAPSRDARAKSWIIDESLPDEKVGFVVILARQDNQWIFCRHKKRRTWELPGGHREQGETALEAARRELYEETGALEYDITPLFYYGVMLERPNSRGLLCRANIRHRGPLPPESEMATIRLTHDLPPRTLWTWPVVQWKLFSEARKRGLAE